MLLHNRKQLADWMTWCDPKDFLSDAPGLWSRAVVQHRQLGKLRLRDPTAPHLELDAIPESALCSPAQLWQMNALRTFPSNS